MQAVDGELVDEVAHGDDEVVGTVGADDSADNHIDISLLVGVAGALVQQLLDDIGEVARQGLSDLGTGILRRDVAAYLDQSVDGDEVPVVQFLLVIKSALDQFELLLGVVDEGAQVFLLFQTQRLVEDLAYFSLDRTRGVAQYMLERVVLSMQVGQEMLGAFGQVENGFEVDDFGAGGCHIGEVAS